MAKEAISELRYHEQQEGWTHEPLQDDKCVCILRPRELVGGFVPSTLSGAFTAADMASLASTPALAPLPAEAGKTASCAMRSTTSKPS